MPLFRRCPEITKGPTLINSYIITLTFINAIHLPNSSNSPVLRHRQGPNAWHLRRSRWVRPGNHVKPQGLMILMSHSESNGFSLCIQGHRVPKLEPDRSEVAASIMSLFLPDSLGAVCSALGAVSALSSTRRVPKAQGRLTTGEPICPSEKGGHGLCKTCTVPVVFIHVWKRSQHVATEVQYDQSGGCNE